MKFPFLAGRSIDVLICAVAGGIFCLLTVHDLWLPGLHYDEVFPAAPAINFVENRYHTEPMQINPSRIRLAGREIPLMLMTYIGSVQTFIYVPSFYFFGDDLTVVRLVPIMLSLLTLWILYLLAREAFGLEVAIIVLVLLLSDTGFVFYIGRDFGPPAVALLCKIAAMYAFYVWWKGGRPLALAIGAFVLGIGLYHKADFLWVIVATLFGAIIFFHRDLRRKISVQAVMTACIAFAVGSGPFLAFNVLTGGATFTSMMNTSNGANLIGRIVSGLAMRSQQLIELMNGTAVHVLFMNARPSFSMLTTWTVPLIILTFFVLGMSLAIFDRAIRPPRAVLLVGFLAMFTFLETTVSPSFGTHHIFASYPFFHLGAAIGLVSTFAGRFGRAGRAKKLPTFLVAMFALIVGFSNVKHTYDRLEETGGVGYWSDAIYDLNDYLLKQNTPVAAMDWGFTNNLIVLSKGQLTIDRVYSQIWKDVDLEQRLESTLNDTTIYLFHSPEYTSIPSLVAAFKQATEARGFHPRTEREFFQRDGRKVYILYKLERI
jgi:hypothetical protein